VFKQIQGIGLYSSFQQHESAETPISAHKTNDRTTGLMQLKVIPFSIAGPSKRIHHATKRKELPTPKQPQFGPGVQHRAFAIHVSQTFPDPAES